MSQILKAIHDAIEKEGDASKLVELNLSEMKISRFTPEIQKVIEQCKNLEILILADCGLESLDNMPDLDLTAIDLTANQIKDAELAKLASYSNLGQLILNENNIQKLESIRVLKDLENLQELDLSDNPISNIDNYREFVFQNLKKLQILDRFDRDGNEQLEEDEFQDSEGDDDQFDEGGEDNDDDDEDDYDEDEEESDSPVPAKKKK